jgi:hypothetical protein
MLASARSLEDRVDRVTDAIGENKVEDERLHAQPSTLGTIANIMKTPPNSQRHMNV